jgi:CubicO group peptidase (beta-lactamase class C family)
VCIATLLTLAPEVEAQRAGGTRPSGSRAAGATKLGFAVDRLARIDSALERAVARGEIVGAVALVMRDGEIAYERAVGSADRESGRRMTTNAIFRIASQSKALTSVAIMMLAEEGKLALGDQVGRYIPAFRQTTVASRADTGRAVVRARRLITIRDLLTHTAGISYGTDSIVAPLYSAQGLGPSAGYGWYTADKDEPICTTMERLAALPFVAQPGERWVYGYNTDILGCVVERVSGVPLDEFIRTRITAPLRMADTHFFLPAGQRDRLATVYASQGDTAAVRAPDGARGQGHYVDGPRRSFSGGAGLLSTARDYGRFLQMLLNGGELDGVRILAPRSVSVMATNQVDALYPGSGLGFGLGFETVERAGAGGRVESAGTYAWAGAYGSRYWVDPAERIVAVFMIQQIPNRSSLPGRFPMLVYQALVEPRVK